MINEAVIEVNEEGNVEFSCQVNGVPAPSLKWYKEAEELPLLTRLEHVTPNRIRIKGARLSDAGVYTCRAVNSEGFAEENITVIVRSMIQLLIFCYHANFSTKSHRINQCSSFVCLYRSCFLHHYMT